MKKIKIILFIFINAALIASCAVLAPAGSRSDDFMEMVEESMPAMEAPAAAKMESDTFMAESEYGVVADMAATNVERIVIKNANLSIVVTDPSQSMDIIASMAEGMGGFVVNSNLYKMTTSSGMEVPTANITVRVPADKLETALDQIKAMVENPQVDILSEDVSGQDVTGEVTDLESRLRNLQAAEEQLLQIMEEARRSEDVLAIFHELTSVREQIEVIQGQIKYYRESASLSAIYVNLQAKEAVEPITIGRWQPGVEVQKAIQALLDGGKYIVNALIWLVLFAIPILALIFLPIYFIVRFFHKRAQRKKASAEVAPQVEKTKK